MTCFSLQTRQHSAHNHDDFANLGHFETVPNSWRLPQIQVRNVLQLQSFRAPKFTKPNRTQQISEMLSRNNQTQKRVSFQSICGKVLQVLTAPSTNPNPINCNPKATTKIVAAVQPISTPTKFHLLFFGPLRLTFCQIERHC